MDRRQFGQTVEEKINNWIVGEGGEKRFCMGGSAKPRDTGKRRVTAVVVECQSGKVGVGE